MRSLILIILFFFLFTEDNHINASHAMGSDLTFECISPGNYLWRLKLYRDCFGIPTNQVQPITITGCGIPYNLSLNLVSSAEVSQLCPSQILNNSSCSGGNLYGVEQYIYEGSIFLPNTCTNYVGAWRVCCRNNSITTVNNPGAQYMYIESEMNTVVPCNNSPVFSNIPIMKTCVGQFINYNHGVTDPDGDSLVFSMVDCLHDGNTSVNYIFPSSAINPLSTVAGITFNSQTGSVSFIPDIIQIGIICIKVEEFRNGVKIGETTRDIQFLVYPCNNNLPESGTFIENGQNTGSYNYLAYQGNNYCLSMEGSDLDGDTVLMYWNNAIPTGTFTVANNNTLTPIGTFCWTPTITDVGIHSFLITNDDDACPVIGRNTQIYTITVVDSSNFAGPQVEAKVHLEGSYDTNGLISEDLRSSGLLPLMEPYTALGYTHIGGGGEMTSPIVFSNTGPDAIVDWVFVELRAAADNTTPVATRSALIQADGDIVDVNGLPSVDFRSTGIPTGSYWVIIRHRNHLDVMSANPIMIDGALPGSYDFTALGAFGGGLKTLPNGAFAMYVGDVNHDGFVNAGDRSELWNAKNQAGYVPHDTSLDGVCNASDRSQCWNNRNQLSLIP